INAVMTLFRCGDHLIVSDDLYGGTYRLIEEILSRFGLRATYADCSDPAAVAAAVLPETKAVFIETPTNPLMKIADIRALSALSKENGLLLIADNTFMTPFFQRPLELGADIVVNSGTKYLSGHNDLLCGFAVARSREISSRIAFIQNAAGAVLSPNDSWLAIRGIKTLALRMERSQENAVRIADWLAHHSGVTEVFYPGLPGHRGSEVHLSQSSGTGAMISFRVTSAAAAEKIINSVRIISFAESLGGCESLITYPFMQTHGAIPEDIRRKIGITDDLLRLSIGIEHCDDLIEDLDRAFKA
ncbi:MAG: trans-sulfuration enzyme family protein, partial [Spirochaetota bacterium]